MTRTKTYTVLYHIAILGFTTFVCDQTQSKEHRSLLLNFLKINNYTIKLCSHHHEVAYLFAIILFHVKKICWVHAPIHSFFVSCYSAFDG